MSNNSKANFRATEEVLRILENSKSESEDAIDKIPGLYVVFDKEGTICRSNNNFTELLRDSKSPDTTKLILDYLDEAGLELFKQKMQWCSSHPGQSQRFEVQFHLQGASFQFSVNLFSWSPRSMVQSQENLYCMLGADLTELKKANAEKEQFAKEMKAAEEVQGLMIPENHFKKDNWEFSCFYQAAGECGGDFVHYESSQDTLKIWCGDVTGHGLGAAMVTGLVKGAISVLEEEKSMSLMEEMKRLNSAIYRTTHGKYWMTFQITEVDFKEQKIRVCQAGHSPIFTYQLPKDGQPGSSNVFEQIQTEASKHLGALETPHFSYVEVPLQKNTLYSCFSDGFEEATNEDGRMYGQRRMLKKYYKSLGANNDLIDARDKLVQSVKEFQAFRPLDDDISFWSFLHK